MNCPNVKFPKAHDVFECCFADQQSKSQRYLVYSYRGKLETFCFENLEGENFTFLKSNTNLSNWIISTVVVYSLPID